MYFNTIQPLGSNQWCIAALIAVAAIAVTGTAAAQSPGQVYIYSTQQALTSIAVYKGTNLQQMPDIEGVGFRNHNIFSSYDGDFLYITADKELVQFGIDSDGKSGTELGRIQLVTSGHLAHVGLSLDGSTAYASDGTDAVHVVDTSTMTLIKAINIPDGLDPVVTIVRDALGLPFDDDDANPHGLAIHPDGRYLYVPNIWSGTVSVIDTMNNKVVNTVNLGAGTGPAALGFSVDGKWAFVSCAVPGYMAILDTSKPRKPTIETTVSVGLSPIQVPANPTNKYFIVPTQTSSLLGNVSSASVGIPDPVFDNVGYVNFILANVPLVLNLVDALLNALNDPVPSPTNDAKNDRAWVVEIDDNFNGNGTPWEVLDIVETGVGPHGISWSPSGEEAYITNSQDPTGSISVVREVSPGDWQEVERLFSGFFPNGITTRFGRNQNQ